MGSHEIPCYAQCIELRCISCSGLWILDDFENCLNGPGCWGHLGWGHRYRYLCKTFLVCEIIFDFRLVAKFGAGVCGWYQIERHLIDNQIFASVASRGFQRRQKTHLGEHFRQVNPQAWIIWRCQKIIRLGHRNCYFLELILVHCYFKTCWNNSSSYPQQF